MSVFLNICFQKYVVFRFLKGLTASKMVWDSSEEGCLSKIEYRVEFKRSDTPTKIFEIVDCGKPYEFKSKINPFAPKSTGKSSFSCTLVVIVGILFQSSFVVSFTISDDSES